MRSDDGALMLLEGLERKLVSDLRRVCCYFE